LHKKANSVSEEIKRSNQDPLLEQKLEKGNRLEGSSILDGLLTLLFNMLKEWEEAQTCIDCIFVEQFLSNILERIDFMNSSAVALEGVKGHELFVTGSRWIK